MSNFELVLPPGVDQQEILNHLLEGNLLINENNQLIIQTPQSQPQQQVKSITDESFWLYVTSYTVNKIFQFNSIYLLCQG